MSKIPPNTPVFEAGDYTYQGECGDVIIHVPRTRTVGEVGKCLIEAAMSIEGDGHAKAA